MPLLQEPRRSGLWTKSVPKNDFEFSEAPPTSGSNEYRAPLGRRTVVVALSPARWAGLRNGRAVGARLGARQSRLAAPLALDPEPGESVFPIEVHDLNVAGVVADEQSVVGAGRAAGVGCDFHLESATAHVAIRGKQPD